MISQYSELESILNKMNFSIDVKTKILYYVKMNEEFVINVSNESYEGDIPNFLICKRKPFTRLVVVVYKLVELKNRYDNLGIPEDIFYDTVSDITLRQEIYFDNKACIGLSKNDVIWFRHLFNMVIFKLGTLQFQIFHMIYLDEDVVEGGYMKFDSAQKEKLSSGAPVINVHIQKDADISPTACDNSFEKAENFFSKYFPKHNYKAFICYSWLLYSGNQKLLNQNSNILNFAKRFEIISEINDKEEAIGRIYGNNYRKKSDFPQKTALQKNALNNFNNLGYACGIINRFGEYI